MYYFFLFFLFFLSSCKISPVQDVTITPEKQKLIDFLTTPQKKETLSLPSQSETPETCPLFNKLSKKIITLQITEESALKDVFKTLATQAKIGIILDKNIYGTLHYQAYQEPFFNVLQNICDMTGLRYHCSGNTLKIEKDTPFLKVYDIQFLSLVRTTENLVAINSSLLGKTETDPSTSNGSSSTISSKTVADFWAELALSLDAILGLVEKESDEESEIIEEKKISSSPSSPNSTYSREKKKKVKQKKPFFSIHKQSGLISVFATERQHKDVENFLTRLRKKTSTQILIEAKVVEVNLKQEFKSGIDWHRLGSYGFSQGTLATNNSFTGDFSVSAPFGSMAQRSSSIISNPETSQVISLGMTGPSLSAVIDFVEYFGTVRTLSSPRLTVLNNQAAILKVAENYVFFDITADRQFLNSSNINYGTLVSATSTPRSIPIGLVMSVHPSIDLKHGEVVLTLRPTISKLISTKEDPGVQLLNQSLSTPSSTLRSEFPVIAVREIDSVLRIKSGGIAVLGGLMTEGAESGSAGIPGTSDSSFGFLTSSKRQSRSVSELVIFIKATILEDEEPVQKADQNLYTTFSKDPRPILQPDRENYGTKDTH